MPTKEIRSCNWGGVIYPDAENYDADTRLQLLSHYFNDFAWILHDKDIKEDGTGELLKPHIHWLGRVSNAVTSVGITLQTAIPDNELERIKSWRTAVKYLVHKGFEKKYQYDVSAVKSTFDIEPYLTGKSEESDAAGEIVAWIIESRCTSTTKLTSWVLEQKLWSVYRRGYSIFNNLLRENSVEVDNDRRIHGDTGQR